MPSSVTSHLARTTLRLFLAIPRNANTHFMKKTALKNQPSESARRSSRACRSPERWAFNHTSERLFALGSTDSIRRFAYRTMMGELRFLPL
jgi:hypothetical protein